MVRRSVTLDVLSHGNPGFWASHDVVPMMMIALKWIAVPIAPLVIAPVLAYFGWLDNDWGLAVFAGASLAALFRWRRLTYRLDPSCRSMNCLNLDDSTKRLVSKRLLLVLLLSLGLSTVALLCLLFVPAARSRIGMFYAFGTMVWASIAKFGFCNLLCNRMLVAHTTQQHSMSV